MAPSPDARERILDAALDLFHAQGVAATGLGEVLERSGTGKGQLYHYFENKDALVLAVMQHFRDKVRSGAIPVKLELLSWKDLEQWFAFFIEFQVASGCQRSCPIGTIGSELRDDQPELQDEACAIFAAARKRLADFFKLQKSRGHLVKSADPDALADFCYIVMQGGLLLSKIERRVEPFKNAVQQALAHVKSLRIQ